jgi:hypothetical protein
MRSTKWTAPTWLLFSVASGLAQQPTRPVPKDRNPSQVAGHEVSTKHNESQNAQAKTDDTWAQRANRGAGASNTNPDGRERSNQDGKSNQPDWWIISLTAGLVLVGGVQAWILKRQTRIINEGLAETRAATRLTREAFILAQRPRILVRNVSVSGDDPETDLFQAHAGKDRTQGRVVSVSCEIFRSALPMIPPYATSTGTAVDIELAPGNGTEWRFQTTPPEVEQQEWRALRERLAPIYVLGSIAYKDKLEGVRISGFCRRWDAGVKRFSQLVPPDPDYEYGD